MCPPPPGALERAQSVPDAIVRVDVDRDLRVERATNGQVDVCWPVDARKIQCKDRQIISPSFELFPDVSCKLMLKPKPKGLSKGLASFQKARGCGSIELKIVDGLEVAPQFSFLLSIGGEARGPVESNFAVSSVCGLAKNDEEWDFKAAVDPASSVFMVSLKVLPRSE